MSLDPRKHAFGFFDEFKNFIFKGNLIDMAVGIIIGTAFGKLVASLVDKIIMPFVGAMTTGGEGDVGDVFEAFVYTAPNGVEIPWGAFVGELVNFLILGLVIFVVIVKFVGALTKKKEAVAAAPPPPPADVQLLTEIRDLLKTRNVVKRDPDAAE